MAAERLAHHDGGRELEVFDPHRGVRDECGPGDLPQTPLTAAMSALVGSDDTMGESEPGGRLAPLARILREAVEEDDRGTRASEVGTQKPRSLANVLVPPCGLHPFRLARTTAVKVS